MKRLPISFHDQTPEAAALRLEQAEIDADIEGLADDEGARALMERLRRDGVPIEERMRRLGAYLRQAENDLPTAAE